MGFQNSFGDVRYVDDIFLHCVIPPCCLILIVFFLLQ